MAKSSVKRRVLWFGVPVVLLALLITFWNWDWFIPIVDSRASAAIGRKVTMSHLHVGLGRVVTVTADGVTVDNPP
ncbi:MAG TPA: AsmA family protein, partial [Rhodopila sp.]|nr:AsmA family protein [Rhodopila sp.]